MRLAAPLPALVNPALASCASTGMFARNEAEIGHELPGIGKAGDVAQFSHNVAAATIAKPRRACNALTWRQRPVRQRGLNVGFKAVPPGRRRLDGRDTMFQQDVMCGVVER